MIRLAKYNVKEVKVEFSFNRYLLTLVNPDDENDYRFVLFDRRRPDEAMFVSANTDDPNGVMLKTELPCLGYFKPTKDQMKAISKLLCDKRSSWWAWYHIRAYYETHTTDLTFWGVIATVILGIISIACSR